MCIRDRVSTQSTWGILNITGMDSGKKIPPPPKRPLSTFFLYKQEVMDDFKKKNPEVGGSVLAKLIATSYKRLSSEKMKALETQAEKKRLEYDKEKEAYEKKYEATLKKTRGDYDDGETKRRGARPKKSDSPGKRGRSKNSESPSKRGRPRKSESPEKKSTNKRSTSKK
eukprot:TRINITY_DN3410_c0_g1_i3.p1 TRINITY_DN3410_c0_g1~~TRINITY_DN3410_c0_g1_i3.p1  ORF type:complete len:194 (-),score=67.32 TRINITY_DN3410_c0_g1_i3:174-680(-)